MPSTPLLGRMVSEHVIAPYALASPSAAKCHKPSSERYSARTLPDLDPIILAGHSWLNSRLAKFKLPWGVQWELARFINAGFNDSGFTADRLEELKEQCSHNNKTAPKVSDLVQRWRSPDAKRCTNTTSLMKEISAKAPWAELDLEAEELKKQYVGCDTPDFYLQNEDWFGGKVHFTGKLKAEKHGDLRLELDRPYLASSTRFSRRFGSERFIRIRMDLNTLHNTELNLIAYFSRPLIIFNRVYRAFYSKENSVFFIHTNEIISRKTTGLGIISVDEPTAGASHTDNTGVSMLRFLDWHNNIDINSNQPMAKWASRFALGLSNSIPGINIDACDLHKIGDIVSPLLVSRRVNMKVPNECIMTDGCGYASADVFKALQSQFCWNTYPTAVQVRINGAKGLLVLDPERSSVTLDEKPQISIRPSQTKISYPAGAVYDRARYTIDVLRSSRMSTPARLSEETIINLAENGVHIQIFLDLLKLSLESRVDRLTTWEGPQGLFQLWREVAKEGSIVSARLAREEAGSARAKGYVYEDRYADEGYEDEDDLFAAASSEHSTAWWEDPVSGCPSGLEDTVLYLLDAGFKPDSCQVLAAKLQEVAKKSLKSCAERFRVDVPMSCSGFVIPDPCGVLRPGEVQIKSSSRTLTDHFGQLSDIIMGEVLLTRHPCKVPTDIQRAVAVHHTALRNYVDVIVVSTKGHIVNGESLARHIASMTGGGDYDGDLMQVFWHPGFVANFRSADKRFADEPASLASCLHKVNESVQSFRERVPRTTPYKEQILEMQSYLLGSLKNASLVGTYNKFWEWSIFKNGYDHDETLRLAYLFCAILDGSKTGVTVDPDQLRRDRAIYTGTSQGPAYKAARGKERKALVRTDRTNFPFLRRAPGLPTFIMEELQAEVQKEYGMQLHRIEERLPQTYRSLDHDLAKPWLTFFEKAKRRAAKKQMEMQYIVHQIEEHVRIVYDAWQTTIKDQARGSLRFSELPIVERQDRLRKISRMFDSGPVDDESDGLYDEKQLRQIKASYAYYYDNQQEGSRSSKGWTRFPWDCAARTLCEIKAEAVSGGQTKTVTQDFYSRFVIHGAFTSSDRI